MMMTRTQFESCLDSHAEALEQIRLSAHKLHDSVGQTYGDKLPYGFHLDMVVDEMKRYGHEVVTSEQDVLPLLFSGYYHDSIEDARQTYNDVKRTARQWMNDEQAVMAAEIVYALTNDKGRSREERAGEHYYEGIRATPYAPFAKLCDRLANVTHSCMAQDRLNERMKNTYGKEMQHFLNGIRTTSNDPRFGLPEDAVRQLLQLIV